MKPSGGSTALSALEQYQKNTHFSLLGGGIQDDSTDAADGTSVLNGVGVIDYLDDALGGGNPFAAAYSYDPSTDLTTMQDATDTYRTWLSDLTPTTSYTSLLSAALSEVDTNFVPTSHIDAEVSSFESKTAPEFARSVNRFTAGMADINAVNSSAFALGLAQLERARTEQLADYRAKLNMQKEGIRAQLAAQFASEMMRILLTRTEHERGFVATQSEVSKTTIIANKEFLAEELELDYKDVTYDLELFGYANSTLAAGLGAAQHPAGPSKASTALASAIGTGTQLASLAGQVSPGLGIGAGLLGAGLSYFTNIQ